MRPKYDTKSSKIMVWTHYNSILGSVQNMSEWNWRWRYRRNECIGTVIIDGGSQEEALNEGRHTIDKSLAKICFAYNTEASIKAADKKEVLELALAYYKISDYTNPLRIESLFSCMSVLARDLLNKGSDGYVNTLDLKNSIKDVRQRMNTLWILNTSSIPLAW
jgi:hypothetical protein